MGRGICFEIDYRPEMIHSFGESDLYDRVPSEADWVQNMDSEEAEEARNCLLDNWKKCGAEVGYEAIVNTNNEEVSVPYIMFSKEAKEQYFQARFDEFKRLVGDWKISDFARTRERSKDMDGWVRDVYHVSALLSDGYGDAVYQTSFSSMDDWLRYDAVPGVKYYLGNCVYMH